MPTDAIQLLQQEHAQEQSRIATLKAQVEEQNRRLVAADARQRELHGQRSAVLLRHLREHAEE